MKSNMECIKNELNQSKKSVSCVSVRLANLNNRLTSLSSNQFIENVSLFKIRFIKICDS